MNTIYMYLGLSGVLTLLLWTPYIVARMFAWGIPTFLNNYPEGFPEKAPAQPLWAARAQRAHLNMVETMPAFIAVTLAATGLLAGNAEAIATVSSFAQLFFFARLAHAVVYILGIPFLRTPVYLVSWFAILAIAVQFI
ncbi:MAPEG family protein [Kordiimonas sp. SCSIO 12610]|uniref:MAPEG family protein n=1 Tax=Kordiimonas sp. SCSIO 12610 TaxID=2829597 RepID=UPI00210DD9D5|nr:MAPEG family protein [Kordiimonas sp. SCSIO 12610]UTW55359.1 MAPEG family protein [Kordiimonas sp. SCSIO 12610]